MLENMVEKDMLENQLDLQLTVLPNQLSEDSVEEVVLKESPHSSMTTPELSSGLSSNKLLEMLLHILNMPEEKLSLLWMLSMLSKDKVELSTVSEVDYDPFTYRVLYLIHKKSLLIHFFNLHFT